MLRNAFALGVLGLVCSSPARAAAPALIGPVPPDAAIDLTLALPIRDEPELDRLIRDQADPASPRFLRYLTPGEFGRRFGATDAQIAALRAWLEARGLTVTAVFPGGLSLKATGPAARVEAAFGARLSRVRVGARERIASDRPPALPSLDGFRPRAVFGLNTVDRAAPMDGGSPPFTPAAINRAYNYQALRDAGFHGQGQSIAICSLTDYSDANVAFYAANVMRYAVPPSTLAFDTTHIIRVPIDGGATDVGGEGDMDVELCLATLPEAKILCYLAPNSNIGMYDIFAAFVNQVAPDAAKSITCSWGFTEGGWLPTYGSYLDSFNDLFKQGAAQGQTFFNSSGDDGSTPVGNDALGAPLAGPSVHFPASAPFMVAVGGTSLFLTPGDVYSSEAGWGGSNPPGSSNPTNGSGGGQSVWFARAPWQYGPGIDAAGTRRLVPDVALDADVSTGYLGPDPNPSVIWLSGGTSASAPQWASATVLLQQALGRPFYLLPLLYHAYRATGAGAPFHDILTGSNGAWACGPGFDMVTGLGSADFGALWLYLRTLFYDANVSGAFDLADVAFVLRAAGGLAPASDAAVPDVERALRGDVDGDGALTLPDAMGLLRVYRSA